MVTGRGAAFLFLAGLIFTLYACGTADDKVVDISLVLPVDWESVIDMEALGAESATPYIGTIRFIHSGTVEEFPYGDYSASFDAGGSDDLTVQAVTAGRVIMEGSVSDLGSASGDVPVNLEKANGFSQAGSLLFPRQNHSAVSISAVVYLLGGNSTTGVIEAVASSAQDFVSSAYAASLVYPRDRATVLHDTAGDQLFVFKGAPAVDDNLYEIVDLENEEIVPRVLPTYRTDYFPVINGQEILLLGGYDTALKDDWQINSYKLDVSEIPFAESILPFVGLSSERQDVMCSVNGLYLACFGGYADPFYLDEMSVFDLSTESAVGGTSMSVGRINSAYTYIDIQTMIVVGGLGQSGYLSDVIEVDLEGQAITRYEDVLHFPRANHTATIVNSNEILIIGGGPTVDSSHTAELLDLTTGESTLLPWRMTVPRVGHTATLLPDGRVLVAGGSATDKTIEVFNPRSGF